MPKDRLIPDGIRNLLPKVFLALVLPGSLLAQAWLPPTGEGTAYLSYQYSYVKYHVSAEGEKRDNGQIRSQGLLMDVDYGLSKKLALRIGLPYLAAEYSGPKPHQLPIDNGTYHGTLQDFRFNLRYSLARRPWMLAPFFEAVIPSHKYEFFAHSAIGRDQREYHLGINAGRRLDPVLPNAYFQARYSYGFVQRVLGISPNQSNTQFQVGYFLTPRFSVLGLGTWRYTHRGIDLSADKFHGGLSDDEWPHHDQISKINQLNLGGAAAFAARPSLVIFGSLAHTVRERNGHADAAIVTVGVSWTFSTARARRTLSAAIPETTTSAMRGGFRCECGNK